MKKVRSREVIPACGKKAVLLKDLVRVAGDNFAQRERGQVKKMAVVGKCTRGFHGGLAGGQIVPLESLS